MLSNDWMKICTRRLAALIPLLAILALLLPSAAVAASSVPAAVEYTISTYPATGLGTNMLNPAIDQCGNLYIQQVNNGTVSGSVYEVPAGGGAATIPWVGLGEGWFYGNYMYMDAAKQNLYIGAGEGGGAVVKIPVVNCALQTGSGSLSYIYAPDGTVVGGNQYFWGASSFVTDALGDVFVASYGKGLFEVNPSGTSTDLLVNQSTYYVSMAIDSNNNLYLAGNDNILYKLAYNAGTAQYSSTPVAIPAPATVTAPPNYSFLIGLYTDPYGNLYVTDEGPQYQGDSTIFVIPNEANGLNPNDEYILARSLYYNDLSAQGPVTTDTQGNLYFGDWTSNESTLSVNYANLGSATVGSTATATLPIVFNASETLTAITGSGAFSVNSNGSCATATAYTAGQTCTVGVNFVPVLPGLAKGTLVLSDANGVVDTVTLTGTGNGAGITSDPGALTSIGSGWTTPGSVAVDPVGDIFIADSGNSKVWEIATGSTTPVAVGSGFSAPKGVAVDGIGNLFVADTGNSQIVEVPVVNGALSTASQKVIVSSSASIAGSTLSSPAGISTDGQDGLYIADTGNSRVVFLPAYDGWQAANAITLGTGFSSPLATTVTASGTIYIADSGNGKVYSLPSPNSGTGVALAATGFSNPSALATDAAGDLFVVDQGNDKVIRIPNVAGSLSSAAEQTVSIGIANPYGLAIDGSGNLYVSDNVNAAAYTIVRTAASQSFGIWSPGTTSDPASFLVENSGNQPLIFNTPYYAVTGNASDFTLIASEADACANGASLAVGASCTLESTFTPAIGGNYSETFAFSSNATNVAAPQAIFTGEGIQTTPTTTALTVTSPTGTPILGQAISLSVTVSAATGTPTGTVALLVDDVQTTTATLSSGSATFSLPNGLGGGKHTLQANYGGAQSQFQVFARSDSAVITFNIAKVATSSAVSFTTAYINPASQPAGTPLTFTATVTPATAGIPTGTVTFNIADSGGTTVAQTATLAPAAGGLFEATYTYTPTAPASGVAYDVVSVTAVYSGDTNFTGSTSSASTFDVAPATGSMTVALSGTGISSGNGENTSTTFTATSYGGWQGVVGYSCLASSLPKNAICVFSPGQVDVLAGTAVAPYPPATTKLSIAINNPPNSPVQSSMLWWLGGLTGLALFFVRRRISRGVWGTVTMLVAAVVLAASASGLTACNNSQFVTPHGATTVTVYADSDPYATNSTNTTQPCGINPATQQSDPTQAPCAVNTFQVKVTVQ